MTFEVKICQNCVTLTGFTAGSTTAESKAGHWKQEAQKYSSLQLRLSNPSLDQRDVTRTQARRSSSYNGSRPPPSVFDQPPQRHIVTADLVRVLLLLLLFIAGLMSLLLTWYVCAYGVLITAVLQL